MPFGYGPLAARHFHFPARAANHRAADTVASGQRPGGDGGQGSPITRDGRSGGPRAFLETWCEASEALARGADAAVSRNTARAVRSDLAIFAQWCAGQGLRDLPAEAETVAAFIGAMAERRAPAHGPPLPGEHRGGPPSAGVGRGAREPARAPRAQTHAPDEGAPSGAGARADLAAPPAPAGGRGAGGVIDARNRALLAVAYDTLLRRAELVSLQVPDLHEGTAGDATVLVRRSKLDGEGRGEIVWIGPDSLGLVRRWLERGRIADGPLFRSVGKGGRAGGALPPGHGAAHPQGDGAQGPPAGGGGRGLVRAQHAGRRGPGHDRRRHRAPRDPPGRAVEDHRDGQPLRGTPAGAAQRRGAAGPPAAAGLTARTGSGGTAAAGQAARSGKSGDMDVKKALSGATGPPQRAGPFARPARACSAAPKRAIMAFGTIRRSVRMDGIALDNHSYRA